MANYTIVIGSIVGVVAVIGAYVYLFGIPPYMKRFLDDKALNAMGENKASFGTKAFIDKLPETDDETTKGIRKDVRTTVGSALQNPLGKDAGNVADDATKPFTGR